MSRPGAGDKFRARRPLRIGRDAPSKLAERRISEHEVRALLDDHVIVDVVEDSDYVDVLLGHVDGRPLIAVVADDEFDDATVLVSVYEPDADHGWTTEKIDRMLGRVS